MLLAALSDTGYALVIGGYLLMVALFFLLRPKDVLGRKRALGCIGGIVVFFGGFVVAFAAWLADDVF